ncbi:MAG: hypothetical protein ABR987_02390 [Terracidiphilus sp.]
MAVIEIQHYLSRARDFRKGMELMELMKEDPTEYRYSSALLGIHGAISYCDALRAGMGSKKLSSEDHSRAASELKSLLDSRRFEQKQGVRHFKLLLSCKTRISYAAEMVTTSEIEDVVKRAIRFADWAEETGEALKIEGW